MRNIFIIISIQLIFISCNQKKENVIKIKPENEFSKAVRRCTKISLFAQKENQPPDERRDSAFVQKESYSTVNSIQIQNFKDLFKNSTKTSYCCCPQANYKIVFYRDQEIIDYYFANTEIKDSIIVFQKGYQSSQRIGKSGWNKLLNEIKLK